MHITNKCLDLKFLPRLIELTINDKFFKYFILPDKVNRVIYQNSRNILTSSSFFSVATAKMDPSQLKSIAV